MADTLTPPVATEPLPSKDAAPALAPGQQIPLPETGLNSFGEWTKRVKASQEVTDNLRTTKWNKSLNLYLMRHTGYVPANSEILVTDAFAIVEQKKAVMLAAVGQNVSVDAKLEGLEQAAETAQAVINHYLSDDGSECVNLPAVCDEVLSDCLSASGMFAAKIGYQPTFDGLKDVPDGEEPDPNWQPAPEDIALSLQTGQPPQAPMVPKFKSVPNLIHEKYFFERLSPGDVLLPEEFRVSDFDRANYIAYRFSLDWEVAKRVLKLPDDFKGAGNDAENDRRLGHDGNQDFKAKQKKVTGVEVYYKAYVYDASVKNPDLQRCLVLVDGMDKPVKHIDSPYQVHNDDGTIGGMPGFPIHVGAIRYVSDKAIPDSDVTVVSHQITERSRFRTIQMLQRERSVPTRLVDLEGIGGKDGLAKFEKAIWQAVIPVSGLMDLPKSPIEPVPMVQYPQENQWFESSIQADMDKATAISANQLGAPTSTTRSASETQAVGAGSGTRMDKETKKFKTWVENGIQKLFALIQMFADEPQVLQITGPAGAKKYVQWDRHAIAGKFAFTVDIDVEKDRAEFIQGYNFLAASPNINRRSLDEIAVRKYNMDPAKLMAPPPQPQAPERMKIDPASLLKDITPLSPNFPIAIELLKQAGYPIPDAVVLMAQQAAAKIGSGEVTVAGAVPLDPQEPNPTPTVGTGQSVNAEGDRTVEKADLLNKHETERTGELTGPKVI